MQTFLFNWFFSLAHQHAIIDALIVFVSSYLSYFLLLSFLVFLYFKKSWKNRLFLFIEGALAVILARGLVTEIIRFFYDSPRPLSMLGIDALIFESSNSFPSGHMTFYFGLAAILWFENRRFAGWFAFFTLLIGAARIAAGVHWPLDIAGGIAIGVASGLVVHQFLKRGVESSRYETRD